MIAALDRSPDGKNAIIVLHGDHGGRIVSSFPTVDNPNAGKRNYSMVFSTLFAVRAPHVDPGVVTGRTSLDELIGELARSNYEENPKIVKEQPQIYLSDDKLIPKERVDLPKYGASLTYN
jgi:hypothetical protein